MKKITCFLYFENEEVTQANIATLQQSFLVEKVFVFAKENTSAKLKNTEIIPIKSAFSSQTMQKIAENANSEFILFYTKSTILELGQFALERFAQIAEDTRAGLLYADYYVLENGNRRPNPTIDYQQGSLRDDFNFGSLLFFDTKILKKVLANTQENHLFSGLYDLRLKISQQAAIFHIPEFLYTEIEFDTRTSGEKQFDYVSPQNREAQIEMENACTAHLKVLGAKLSKFPKLGKFDNSENFPVEASVVIPVKNRAKTIADAVHSVLAQKTDFKFNIIVVDNFSTDETTKILDEIGKNVKNLIRLTPDCHDLGIGGCWNVAIQSEFCGKFAVQLDSDDLYQDENTLQTVVDTFYAENCAMVIGSYTMTDFALQPIPPYLIDHREWTEENGRNNALRINGLGAPRAFYTPILRKINFPNTSYGEDYALGLRISREWKIGRIYRSIYLCRRWQENSDAALDITKTNANNFYKDKIRTIELQARILQNL